MFIKGFVPLSAEQQRGDVLEVLHPLRLLPKLLVAPMEMPISALQLWGSGLHLGGRFEFHRRKLYRVQTQPRFNVRMKRTVSIRLTTPVSTETIDPIHSPYHPAIAKQRGSAHKQVVRLEEFL